MPDSSPRPKPIALAELATALEGRLDGPSPGPFVSGIAPITEAGPDHLTFLTDAKKIARHAQELKNTRASAVIAAEGAGALPLPSIRFANPYVGLARALAYFHPEELPPVGIHPTAFVDEEAEIDLTASIGPMAVVEAGARIGPHTRIDAQCNIGRRVVVGSHTHLHPRVTVLADGRIGSHTIIHSGAVLGSDGFGFVTTREGHGKVPQVGIVEIGDRVEIGANVTIDRATMGKTIVGDGTKIDNLVHIAHNVVIGRDCLIVAQVGISGSTVIGDRVTLAGQVGTVGHVTIGHGTTVAARGVVTQDVEPNSLVSGFPIKPHSEEKRILAALRRLPDLLKTVRDLEGRPKKESHP